MTDYTALKSVAQVEEDGFTIIPSVFSEQDISTLTQSVASGQLRRNKAGVRHALRHSTIAAIAHDDKLLHTARLVLGNEAFPFRATVFDKSPHSNWLVVWHQDTALPLRQKHETPNWGPWSVKDGVIYAHAPTAALAQVLALRVHLDDSTADNGPLRVLPATHKMGVLSDEEILALAARVKSRACLVSRGGVLAMRPLIVHASSKSQSPVPRRVLHIEYAASWTTEDGLELAVA